MEQEGYESKYLIREQPAMFSPTLAQILGLDAAVILQCFHFLLANPFAFENDKNIDGEPTVLQTKRHEGRRYVRIEYELLLDEERGRLRYYSRTTMLRWIYALRNRGFLLAEPLDRDARNRTNWFSVNYAAIREAEESFDAGLPVDKVLAKDAGQIPCG